MIPQHLSGFQVTASSTIKIILPFLVLATNKNGSSSNSWFENFQLKGKQQMKELRAYK
jgi:hypothetical protein